ncbi:hypothetical protein FC756_16060 [Lysinibacillus mangiferihumi]|uniref:Uncharacterized protein n=1 Tax=Lysinibacillus mangiferihumi TaxID=1130819 RepID=A0A4U2YWJ1_9BACI|nr:hypothetical protein [Lysinibacillus mangiferihumi]TKI65564.1 hypothetical protein FC756_16060 [Lysinibacillus mangiferihumi]
MARVNVRITDTNNINRLKNVLRELKNHSVEVGIFGSDEYVMIASVHEFGATIRRGEGTITIPERSFLRTTFDEKNEEWVNFFKSQLKQVLRFQMDVQTLFNRLGARMVVDIQKKITNLDAPPNAPSTINKKKSSNPLIDTGGLRMRVTYKVVRK